MRFYSLAVFTAILLSITLACAGAESQPKTSSQSQASQSQTQERRAVNPPGTPTGLPFSNGIVAGNTLYVAGQEGTDSQGKLLGSTAEQTRAALETIRTIVQAAGFSMSDVVAVNVYLADINDFGAMNDVYKTFFPDPKPTRTTIQAAKLVNNGRIEISAIAVKH